MSTDTIILAAAAFIGPTVAVGLTLWRQSKFEEVQRELRRAFLKELEEQRSEFERQLKREREDFDKRWNRAELTGQDRMIANLRYIVLALKPDCKFPRPL